MHACMHAPRTHTHHTHAHAHAHAHMHTHTHTQTGNISNLHTIGSNYAALLDIYVYMHVAIK